MQDAENTDSRGMLDDLRDYPPAKDPILIVDDKVENLIALEGILKNEPYKVDVASSGEEALTKLLQHKYAMILLDVQMPGMDGFEVADILYSSNVTREIPIIFISAIKNSSKYVRRGLEAGAIDYISKPIDPIILKLKISALYGLFEEYRLIRHNNHELHQTHGSLKEYTRNIQDSISDAQRIQENMLPDRKIIKNIFPDSFIMYRPRDIVSGDFYWFNRDKDKIFFAAVDCTGHGVPGALMSMIGNNLLNQLIIANGIYNSHIILHYLHSGVCATLKNNGPNGLSGDGMDIAMCVYYPENRILEFSGAHRPLIIVRNGTLMEYVGDKVSIGGDTPDDFTFKQVVIQLEKGDCLYMFSDGFPDQFGGPRDKKFSYTRLKKLLMDIQTLPMEQQRQVLQGTFDNWQGANSQIDDVLVMGLKIP